MTYKERYAWGAELRDATAVAVARSIARKFGVAIPDPPVPADVMILQGTDPRWEEDWLGMMEELVRLIPSAVEAAVGRGDSLARLAVIREYSSVRAVGIVLYETQRVMELAGLRLYEADHAGSRYLVAVGWFDPPLREEE